MKKPRAIVAESERCAAITNTTKRCLQRAVIHDLCMQHHIMQNKGHRVHRVKNKMCNAVHIKKDTCYIKFIGENKCRVPEPDRYNYTRSREGFTTVNGDDMIIDFNKYDEIISIELIGDDKQCQKGGSNEEAQRD